MTNTLILRSEVLRGGKVLDICLRLSFVTYYGNHFPYIDQLVIFDFLSLIYKSSWNLNLWVVVHESKILVRKVFS